MPLVEIKLTVDGQKFAIVVEGGGEEDSRTGNRYSVYGNNK